jgi:predicted RNA binding protein YcfA (HicA-like mRNA interferase family)
MVLKAKEVEQNLRKKGFRQKESNHHQFVFVYNGKETMIRTKTSHNHQEINDFLIDQMSKQIHLNKSDFISFVNCKINEQEYIEIQKTRGFIPA